MHKDNRRITYRRDVTFNELCFSFNPTVATGNETNTVMHGKGNSEPTVEPQLVERAEAEVPGVVGPRRGDRQRRQPAPLGIKEVLVAEMEVVHSAFSATQIPEPHTMKEAMDSGKAEQWKEVACAEYDSLQEHETWTLWDLPPNRKPVGSKWVFKVKYDERGEANRNKARLVAQGFSQTPGVDLNETFAPVARFGTIRMLRFTVDPSAD